MAKSWRAVQTQAGDFQDFLRHKPIDLCDNPPIGRVNDNRRLSHYLHAQPAPALSPPRSVEGLRNQTLPFERWELLGPQAYGAYGQNDRNLQAFCRRWSVSGYRQKSKMPSDRSATNSSNPHILGPAGSSGFLR
jgi:hypothetical protein